MFSEVGEAGQCAVGISMVRGVMACSGEGFPVLARSSSPEDRGLCCLDGGVVEAGHGGRAIDPMLPWRRRASYARRHGGVAPRLVAVIVIVVPTRVLGGISPVAMSVTVPVIVPGRSRGVIVLACGEVLGGQ